MLAIDLPLQALGASVKLAGPSKVVLSLGGPS